MDNKGKRIKSENGEILLPEQVIQHIQSFMSGEEAAQTTVLSKSWYNAWLTRPVLDLDYRYFPEEPSPVFEKYAKKTVQRYQGSKLKIERFTLRVDDSGCSWVHDLIVKAINIGATDVEIDFPSTDCILPKEVLGSQTLHRFSVSFCVIDGNFTRCSSLQSLILQCVKIASDDGFKDIISCCGSIEDLSLSNCFGLTFSRVNLPKLPKLGRLILERVDVDDTFFTDFASRFPCLKDLAILNCNYYTRVGIASTSLQTICFTTMERPRAKFDVPNIRKFTYSGSGLPSPLSIEGGSTEWELDISIECCGVRKNSWFLKLKKLLTKFRLSRIYVSLDFYCGPEHEVDISVLPKPLVVENLVMNGYFSVCQVLLFQLFGVFRPKFLTLKSWRNVNAASFATLCKSPMQKPITPNCGIPDQDMFGKFGLKKVNAFGKDWQPLMLEKLLVPSETPVNNQYIRFELIWD